MTQHSPAEYETLLDDYLDGITDYRHLITTADKYAEKNAQRVRRHCRPETPE